MVVSHHVVAGNWTQDLWKSSQCSSPLSHLFSPWVQFLVKVWVSVRCLGMRGRVPWQPPPSPSSHVLSLQHTAPLADSLQSCSYPNLWAGWHGGRGSPRVYSVSISHQPEYQGCGSEKTQEEKPAAPAIHGPQGLASGAGAVEHGTRARSLPSAFTITDASGHRGFGQQEATSQGQVRQQWPVQQKVCPQRSSKTWAHQVCGHWLWDGGYGPPRTGERASPLLCGELQWWRSLWQIHPAWNAHCGLSHPLEWHHPPAHAQGYPLSGGPEGGKDPGSYVARVAGWGEKPWFEAPLCIWGVRGLEKSLSVSRHAVPFPETGLT
jgi:hypothetical protein